MPVGACAAVCPTCVQPKNTVQNSRVIMAASATQCAFRNAKDFIRYLRFVDWQRIRLRFLSVSLKEKYTLNEKNDV